jgi:hypothetical protein
MGVPKPRELEFTNMKPGEDMMARCSVCKRPFRATPKFGESADSIVLRLRADFAAHNCNEDATQAAARIVREATDEK